MKRTTWSVLLLCAMPMLAAPKINPAEYTVAVHVSASRYAAADGLSQILSVAIDGKHYELQGGTSSAKVYGHGNGLLDPGDYKAKLSIDQHKTPFESVQQYEILLPDGTTRPFSVILQSE
jgi:hypothetical protein